MAEGRRNVFSVIALWTARQCGRPATFGAALAVIIIWAATGPLFHYSDTWQLVINTGTSLITFLMVFLIQHSQNRDTAAIQLKLDELIRSSQHARNAMLSLDEMEEADLEKMRTAFATLGKSAPEVLEELTDAQEDLQEASDSLASAKDLILERKAGSGSPGS